MTVNEFVPVRVGHFSGFCLTGFNLSGNWERIWTVVSRGQPVYNVSPGKKVFLINLGGGISAYLKTIDETWKNIDFLRCLAVSEGRRYFRNYLLISETGVASPKMLFFLEKKRGLVVKESMVGTIALQGFETWYDFFSHLARDRNFPELKHLILNELAWLAGRMHRTGFYFSLDGRNICVRSDPDQNGRNNIAILDLGHVKHSRSGRLPERRRLRNLQRLTLTLEATEGINSEDHRFLASVYDLCFFSCKQAG
jgi:hypothetical protein